jgi:tRNA U38,U39,U40 pseudouridine synthase TruA
LYRIDIFLVGALYKMVRNMVGTAFDVCRGRVSEEKFLELLTNPSELSLSRKENLSEPARPQGLTLERVFYPNDDF